jgi:hypothetical protein
VNRRRILLLELAAVFLTLGKAHAQYAYVTHPNALVNQPATTAVLPANSLRAFVYCVIASPGKGQPLAPSVVTMGDATTGVLVQYPDRPPQLLGEHRRGLGLFGSNRPDFLQRACHSSIPNAAARRHQIAVATENLVSGDGER